MSAGIVGIGELAPSRTTPGAITLGLIAKASKLAIDDAQMSPGQLDGLFVGPLVGETPQHVPATVAEYLGLAPRVASLVDLGGASALGMLWRACKAIDAGMCTTALCVLAASRDPMVAHRAANRNPIREFDVPHGASGANLAYALSARAHMDQFGTRPEQLAWIAVAERQNAQLNPDAVFYDRPLTLDDVLESPLIVDPIHREEAVMPCGGAAAFIVSSESSSRSVDLLGAGELVTHRAASHNPDFTKSPLVETSMQAYQQASLGPADVDLWSLYDCYTIMVAISVEDVGICDKGEAGGFLFQSDFGHRSRTPINTHGGQLGCGQADLAGGMGHLIEAVRQIRHEAGPRQVPGCEVSLVTGVGATMSEAVTVLVGRET